MIITKVTKKSLLKYAQKHPRKNNLEKKICDLFERSPDNEEIIISGEKKDSLATLIDDLWTLTKREHLPF